MQDDDNTVLQMRFPQKLWYLVNLQTDAILWGGTGRTILLNYRVLHSYLQCKGSIFKTTNISSFVRQLNLYGFRKVTSHLQDPLCNSSNPYMHEYIHDFFQFGRPELLAHITRKALAVRKPFKAKSLFGYESYLYSTRLQKARHALHSALRKATQDLILQKYPKEFYNIKFDGDEDFGKVEGNVDFDWVLPNNHQEEEQSSPPNPVNQPVVAATIDTAPNEENIDYGDTTQDLMNFNDDSQQNNDTFPGVFLDMPDLDPVPTEDNSGELLAEFNIDYNANDGITSKTDKHEDNSMNCLLLSAENEQHDFASMDQNIDPSDHYDGEWDQMFNDIIVNKSANQDSGSDLKELYSQISRTIDLLND